MSTVSLNIRQQFSTRSDFNPRKHLALSKDILIIITGQVGVLQASGGEHATMHTSALYYTVLCCVQLLSHIPLFATPKECATCQAPLVMGFSRQEYQSALPFASPGNLPNPGVGVEPMSSVSPALAGRFFTTVPPGKP